VSKKSESIARRIASFKDCDLDAHYLAYFECFNRQEFYEAHDVLEELWLADRHGTNGLFYKGLIQLAGAFVHLQKHRLGPAGVLFKLAQTNLEKYPGRHEHLEVREILVMIEEWLFKLQEKDYRANPLHSDNAPRIKLEGHARVVPAGQPRESTSNDSRK